MSGGDGRTDPIGRVGLDERPDNRRRRRLEARQTVPTTRSREVLNQIGEPSDRLGTQLALAQQISEDLVDDLNEVAPSLFDVGTPRVLARPRGVSALPGPPNVALEQHCSQSVALTQLESGSMGQVADLDDLLDADQVAHLLGLSGRGVVSVYAARYPDFPPPVVRRASGRCQLWLRSDVEAWATARRGE